MIICDDNADADNQAQEYDDTADDTDDVIEYDIDEDDDAQSKVILYSPCTRARPHTEPRPLVHTWGSRL